MMTPPREAGDEQVAECEAAHKAGQHDGGRPQAIAEHQSGAVKPDHLEDQPCDAR